MSEPTICGIDPGKHGGIAFLPVRCVGETCFAETFRMPVVHTKKRDVCFSAVARILKENQPRCVIIERVHAMPKQGVVSMFSFGVSFGGILGCCSALQIPVILVAPQTWKKAVLSGFDRSDKHSSIAFCASYFSDVRVDGNRVPVNKIPDGVADALCLAVYGQRVIRNSGG